MIDLFHTSPEKISEINKEGLFGSGLFFSRNVYSMCGPSYLIYKLEIDEDELIDLCDIYRAFDDEEPLLKETLDWVKRAFDIDDNELAFEILCAKHFPDFEDSFDSAEMSYLVQHMALDAAMALGYRGVILEDEQGKAALIDMFGHEEELIFVGER